MNCNPSDSSSGASAAEGKASLKREQTALQVVKTFDEEFPYEVPGAFHTALLLIEKNISDTLESTCWTFARGDNRQLGHGTTQNTLLPTSV
ncbi:hypothetical protein Fmac_000924 [Flemingia macrophylla]|uniref:Uncharacterized protein n=1 Tax=Flemingia macrophylla TaxID=520843 RepID=A0ABD1NFM9_9FABA